MESRSLPATPLGPRTPRHSGGSPGAAGLFSPGGGDLRLHRISHAGDDALHAGPSLRDAAHLVVAQPLRAARILAAVTRGRCNAERRERVQVRLAGEDIIRRRAESEDGHLSGRFAECCKKLACIDPLLS